MITDVFLAHKRINVYEHTVKTWRHMKVLEKYHQRGCERKVGGVGGMEGKLNGNHLRLIPGLCLEDRTN